MTKEERKELERKELEKIADELREVVVIGSRIGYLNDCASVSHVELNENRVNHPSHYNKGIETIDYIESWNMDFNIGNVIKYVTRAGHKDNKLEDLEKAKWYLEREINKAKVNI